MKLIGIGMIGNSNYIGTSLNRSIQEVKSKGKTLFSFFKKNNYINKGDRNYVGGTNLNCIAHKWCVRRSSADGWKQQDFLEKVTLTRWKELVDRAGLNHLQRAT